MSKEQYPNPSLYNEKTRRYTIPQGSTTDINMLTPFLSGALTIAKKEKVTVTFVHEGKDKKGNGAFKLSVSPNSEIKIMEESPDGRGHEATIKSPQPKKSL